MTGQNHPSAAELEVPARAVPDMLFRLSGDGVILDAKPGEDVEFYVPLEAFLGKRISEVLPPQVTDPARTAIRAALHDGLIHSFEYQLDGEDGTGYYEARIIRAGDDEVIAIVRNMTERYLAQAMLATQSAVAEHMAEGAIILRQNGEAIVWANPRMDVMLGYEPGALRGLNFKDLIADTVDYAHTFLPTVSASLARSGRWLGETPLKRREGSSVWCEISVSRFDHPTLGPAMVVLASDISERQADRVIERTLERVGKLLADRDTDVSKLAEALVAAIAEATDDCSSVALADNETGWLSVVASHNIESNCSHTFRRLAVAPTDADTEAPTEVGSKSTDATAPLTGTTVMNNITEQQQQELFDDGSNALRDTRRIRALLVAPIVVFGTCIGTITTIRHKEDCPYSDQDASLLESIATRAGPVIENARIRRELVEGAEFVSSTQTGMVRIGSDLTVLSWNPGAEEITGYSKADIVGQPISVLGRSTQTHAEDQQRFAKLVKADSPIQYEVERTHKDGFDYWLSVDLWPIHSPRGAIVGAAAAFVDITEQRRTRTELETLARTDPLTGLANRAEFQQVLSRAFVRHRRFGIQGALLVIDLDDFRHINDEHGHRVGDDVLKEVAVRLRAEGRDTDVVARIGADEFGVLIDPADFGIEGAVDVARRLLDALGNPCQIAGESLRLDASCGIALLPEDGRDPDTLLQHAEKAMYSARRSGGGHVERYRKQE